MNELAIPEPQSLETWLDGHIGPWMGSMVAAAVALTVALAAHGVLYAALGRFVRGSAVGESLVRGTRMPTRWAMLALGALLGLEGAPADLPGIGPAHQFVVLLTIGALTWTALRAVHGVGTGVLDGYRDSDIADEYQARRVRTQTRVLTRIAGFLAVTVGIAAMLMTFPAVRQIGASMLASAGVAGLVVGFAARPVLANLLAGLQIALTQPIRIGDVVIVEKEWGWIEQIFSTYVVVRVWDERRLVVPLNYFIEHPFQNWTRDSSQLIGSVHWWVDYRMPLAPLRTELERLCNLAPEWDKRLQLLQVVDAGDRAVQLRALVSAPDAAKAWDLRCRIREGMLDFIQREYPQFLPQIRAEPATDKASAAFDIV
ncbi:mechanosensitive ion channel domain-containing protein [Azoarcus sp. L1K30]|uniref:mechanosensitive ion channel family protein n=1 Tax=Azoarcus sp. L1K30 TaxID=2820277 RepID=UPI0020139CC7|nr:mechanosensitive ion channel domain-containing protein [Azoarcus sp. L1K30]